MQYGDVMRQTRTGINSAAEDTANDNWNDEIEASPPASMDRNQKIPNIKVRTELPDGYKWMNVRTPSS